MRLVPEERWQQGLHFAWQRLHSDMPTVPENESQVSLQGVDGNDEEVGQWREVQGERDIGNRGCDVAAGGRKA